MMKLLVVLVSVLIAACAESGYRSVTKRGHFSARSVTCEDRYEKTEALRSDNEQHTMCKYPPQSDSGGVSDAEIKAIVDKHNHLRKHPQIPETAAAMCLMYWDPEIAEIAQHYADSCPTGHDKNNIVPGYGARHGGQNLAWGSGSWDEAIQGWFNEVHRFKHGTGSTNGSSVGHYTQVMKDTACRIGCGFAMCEGRANFVCNYLTGQTNYKTPFVIGAPCSGCPNSCVDEKLCDTSGKMCYHGTMDYSTNICECEDNYSGDSCEILTCTGTEKFACGNNWNDTLCTKWRNVPYDCPIMCGSCNEDKTAGDNWIPAPAVTLKAGSLGSAGSFPAGEVESSPDEPDAGNDVDCATAVDRDFCTWWVQDAWCNFGDRMTLTWSGEPGTPLSFCPIKCGVC